ncbi:hypothetical protein BDV95DRAFT_590445 [Massariosphaeria phaeospora]|uniref:Uncharacterized protein n=1 Tax=Massariosphaeria phaeospora TaxID=100035 RepID=A0A7C8IF75_9PLEO|nr:hypothetical protein BDV95DRAFT_590445 [Massariosphaeria phaeospora]
MALASNPRLSIGGGIDHREAERPEPCSTCVVPVCTAAVYLKCVSGGDLDRDPLVCTQSLGSAQFPISSCAQKQSLLLVQRPEKSTSNYESSCVSFSKPLEKPMSFGLDRCRHRGHYVCLSSDPWGFHVTASKLGRKWWNLPTATDMKAFRHAILQPEQ